MTDGKRYIPLNILPDGSRKIISRPIYMYVYIYIYIYIYIYTYIYIYII